MFCLMLQTLFDIDGVTLGIDRKQLEGACHINASCELCDYMDRPSMLTTNGCFDGETLVLCRGTILFVLFPMFPMIGEVNKRHEDSEAELTSDIFESNNRWICRQNIS